MSNISKDKALFDEILNEIDNLKKYNNELNSNTRGEKLENYINIIDKNINLLQNDVERIYGENFNNKDTIE